MKRLRKLELGIAAVRSHRRHRLHPPTVIKRGVGQGGGPVRIMGAKEGRALGGGHVGVWNRIVTRETGQNVCVRRRNIVGRLRHRNTAGGSDDCIACRLL